MTTDVSFSKYGRNPVFGTVEAVQSVYVRTKKPPVTLVPAGWKNVK